jgi:hypothetical protein
VKLVYFHIPKTAGSFLNAFLETNARGLWLPNGALKELPADTWRLDYLSGHFTRQEFREWIERRDLKRELAAIRQVTMLRHPVDQIVSNLNFPLQVQTFGSFHKEAVMPDWMTDYLAIDHSRDSEIVNFLDRHPWLMNLQWQYLVTGSDLDQAVSEIDFVGLFPSVSPMVWYCANQLGVIEKAERLQVPDARRNDSEFQLLGDVLTTSSALQAYLIRNHRLDFELYLTFVRKKCLASGLESALQFLPTTPEGLLGHWIAARKAAIT